VTILVVDDDARIRAGVVAILSEAGYMVRGASGGAEALALLGADQSVQLLVTDVLMPGMKGTELAPRALAHRPDLQVIYMSGDIGDTPIDAFGAWPLLRKPFTAATLLGAVREAFGANN
jgi:DNA-binding NtrC family response regulator